MKQRRTCFLLISALCSAGCGSNSTQGTVDAAATGKLLVATAAAGSMTVDLLTETRLETGMTPVYIRITSAGGTLVTDASLTLTPMMAMSNGVNHTCPLMGPPTLGGEGLYATNVVFLMPTSEAGSWSATVDIARPDGTAAQASFPVLTIYDSGRLQTFSYTDPATAVATKFITSLNFVAAPRVGLNPIIFTVHRKQDMMTFPSVDDATIALDPEMPSMGHGSPGSVDPVLTAPGRYEGQLSFSMAGAWQTTATVSEGGVVLGTPIFATTF